MVNLSERRVLVTGAAGGLGTDLVRFLLKANASVLATDIDANKELSLKSSLKLSPEEAARLRYLAVDQSDPKAVALALEREFRAVGGVDSLVNNAAIYPLAPAETMDVEEFARVQAVNVEGSFAFVRACLPYMKQRQFGRIINIASITFDTGFVNLSAYVASKAALIGVARVWAREFGPDGITVNCVSPGAFPTDAEKIHSDPDSYNQFVIDRQAVKRRGEPRDFASLVMFLLSKGSDFITGQNIRVDGGWVMN